MKRIIILLFFLIPVGLMAQTVELTKDVIKGKDVSSQSIETTDDDVNTVRDFMSIHKIPFKKLSPSIENFSFWRELPEKNPAFKSFRDKEFINSIKKRMKLEIHGMEVPENLKELY